jgi:preprotein translocase subunit SecA
VGLRGYGQKDPLNEYKSEAFGYFEQLMSNVRQRICSGMFRSATSVEAFQAMLQQLGKLTRATTDGQAAPAVAAPQRAIAPAAAKPGAAFTPPQVNTTVTRGGVVRTAEPGGTPSASSPASATAPATPRKEVQLPKIEAAPKPEGPKLGRNDPCPLDPAKKFKNCCGSDGSKSCWKSGLK